MTARIVISAVLFWPLAVGAAALTAKVAPSPVQVRLNGTQAFMASYAPSGVTTGWVLVSTAPNSKPDSSGALGAINSSGLYTAPSAMPTPNTLDVEFVDTTHGTVLSSATVTLLNPVPVISSLTPSVVNAGEKSAVVIAGSGFVPGSILMLNGAAVPASKVVVKSATEIDYTDIQAAPGNITVVVANPQPDGSVSAGRTLTVNPAVKVTLSASSTTVRAGTSVALHAAVQNSSNQSVTFTVGGAANGNSTVGAITTDLNGNPYYSAPSTLPGASVLIVATSVADATASAALTINLQNPIPVIGSVTPSPLTIDATATITVTGQNFVPGAQVTVGGVSYTTTYNSPTNLTATGNVIPAVGRQLAVVVSNPAPGPVSSLPAVVPETAAQNCSFLGETFECVNYAGAVRFLEMATWGPTPASIAHLQEIGFDAWFAEQFAMPATPWAPASTVNEGADSIQTEFFNHALMGNDQLRQRLAFALSEIFVVSADKDTNYQAMRAYMTDLSNNAFGTYRNLLGVMTLDPAMGWYLDMANNDKANPAQNTAANENYAREVMQLFSVGLNLLYQSGLAVTPAVSLYDESVVQQMAKVFTGWTYSTSSNAQGQWPNPQYFGGPMIAFPDHHDETQKTISLGGQSPCNIPANGTPAGDLQIALDCLAGHPNVAPFISYRLIQRLVKSNPSPEYVSDIANVFNATGGNLQNVVQAILMHSEATMDANGSDPNAGKLREPALYATSLLRALNATVSNAQASGLDAQSANMGQQVLYAPSVFNYFSPFYRIQGSNMVAPEFQILNASSGLSRLNFAYRAVNNQVSGNIQVDLSNLIAVASAPGGSPALSNAASTSAALNPTGLVAAINEALYHNEMPYSLQTELQSIATQLQAQTTNSSALVTALLYYAAAAPAYQVQQ